MNVFTIGLVHHVSVVYRLLQKYGLEAHITMSDFVLHVRGRHRYYRFCPQYLCVEDGGEMRYSPELLQTATGFVGWRPYFNKRWPIGFDKFAFKAYCQKRGLPTPAMWRTPSPEMRDFVVKHSGRSFGQGLHGPFRTYDPGNHAAQAVPQLGYYEAYVPGKIVKAWYWQDRVVSIDVKRPPQVVGDGQRSLRELLTAIVRPNVPRSEWSCYAEVAAYQGLRLEDIPAKGQAVLADFRFGTYAEPVMVKNQNKLQELGDSPLGRQLREYGPSLWQGIPEDLRDATLFAIDAVLDDKDKVWLLEMNCNPVCHPDAYDPMFETLFGPPDAKTPAPIPAESALPYTPLFVVPPGAPAAAGTVSAGEVPPAPESVSPAPVAASQRFRWLS